MYNVISPTCTFLNIMIYLVMMNQDACKNRVPLEVRREEIWAPGHTSHGPLNSLYFGGNILGENFCETFIFFKFYGQISSKISIDGLFLLLGLFGQYPFLFYYSNPQWHAENGGRPVVKSIK